MLSNGFDTPLHLTIKPSRTLFLIRLAAHALAILAVSLPLGIDLEFKIALYFFILTSLVFTLTDKNKRKNQQRNFRWRESHNWIESVSGREVVWVCQRGAIITNWFVIVTLQQGKKRQSIFIGADQCTKQLYRRLLVRLKYLTNPTQDVLANSTDSR